MGVEAVARLLRGLADIVDPPAPPPMIDDVGSERLGRNQPRRLGCMELVVRPHPWILSVFTGKVPDNFIAQTGVGEVEVPCPCKAVTAIPWNIATPCEGNCDRWFWYFAGTVRVAYLSSHEQDDDGQDQGGQGNGADNDERGHVPD
jgi:hypothetical protein